MYCVATNLKSVSSMKMHRDLDITQKSAWFLLHRVRHVWNTQPEETFEGPVEVDETYMGGKLPLKKRAKLEGRGPVGKTAIVGMKDRTSNQVSAKVIEDPPRRHSKVSSMSGFNLRRRSTRTTPVRTCPWRTTRR